MIIAAPPLLTWLLRTLYFVLSLVYATGCFNALLNARTRPAYLLLIPLGALPLWMLHRLMLSRMRQERSALMDDSRFERARRIDGSRSDGTSSRHLKD